jgi:hypothetical protein
MRMASWAESANLPNLRLLVFLCPLHLTPFCETNNRGAFPQRVPHRDRLILVTVLPKPLTRDILSMPINSLIDP